MRTQRDQLRGILRDSSAGLGQLSGDNLLPPAAEKSIRQVLHQLNHLRNVWSNVLPLNIYKRAIGTILNSVLEELVERVIVLEDIAADSAVQICSLFTVVKEKAADGKLYRMIHFMIRTVIIVNYSLENPTQMLIYISRCLFGKIMPMVKKPVCWLEQISHSSEKHC